MTKEAKVGLLLGLAFIVAIAVILRGVHQGMPNEPDESLLMGGAQANNQAAASHPENLSVAVEKLSPAPALQPAQASPPPMAAQPTPPAPAAPSSLVVDLPPGSTAEKTVAANDIRFVHELPSAASTSQPAATPPAITPPSGTVDRAVDRVAMMQPVESGTIPAAGQVVRGQINPVVLTAGAKSVSFKGYTVAEGDDLTRIAKKVYGAEAGGRWVNVVKIYEANRQTMASMDNLKVGQSLVIPMVEGAKDSKPAAQPVATPVASSGTPKPEVAKPEAAKPEAAKPETAKKTERVYVVKEGDSLWQIAQRELGAGNRFEEIIKLNNKTLTKNHNLKVGMKLQLPEK